MKKQVLLTMIKRIVKMTFREGEIDNFLTLFKRKNNQIALSEGCIQLELWHDKNKANVFFTYSTWLDETYLEKYRQSDLFNSVWTETKKLFAEKPEAWTIEEVAV